MTTKISNRGRQPAPPATPIRRIPQLAAQGFTDGWMTISMTVPDTVGSLMLEAYRRTMLTPDGATQH